MNLRNIAPLSEKRLLDAPEACQYISMGKNRGIEFLRSIGVERKIGKRCLYDKILIDRYFDTQAGEE